MSDVGMLNEAFADFIQGELNPELTMRERLAEAFDAGVAAGVSAEAVAKVCHEANRVFQEYVGDEASPKWEDVSAHIQASAIAGVQQARAGATPRELHDSWVRFKRAAGWVHGATKDEERKTHPCLVHYDLLPMAQRMKDDLFLAIVKALS